jgi:hypothetical protein
LPAAGYLLIAWHFPAVCLLGSYWLPAGYIKVARRSRNVCYA